MPETTSNTTAADEASPATPLFMASADLTVLSPVQRGFVQSIRALDVEARDIPLTGAQLKAAVADEFPPGVLFGPDLEALPLALRELRRWLDSHGAALGTHPSHRVPPLLAASLYSDADNTVAAKEIVRVQLAAGRRANAAATTDDSPSASGHTGGSSSAGGTNPPDRLAHNVAMRFKDKSAKFSGGPGEAWMEYVADYQHVSREYNLTGSQRLQFMHNLLAGDAKRFPLPRFFPPPLFSPPPPPPAPSPPMRRRAAVTICELKRERVLDAVKLVRRGWSVRNAMDEVNFNIDSAVRASVGSIHRALHPPVFPATRMGRPTNLLVEQGQKLSDAVKAFQLQGFNITKLHLIQAVSDIISDIFAEEKAK